ncbi:MAG: hypothetical protein SFX73_06255 [Kofleriaceae bacterium]|nr:hypothetical protein [Kofleriaceae bacterium]
MSYRSVLALGVASLTACATAVPGEGPDAQSGRDGPVPSDGNVDGPPQVDADCSPMQMELLINPAFDVSGGWEETRIDPQYGIVVSTGGVAPLTAPNKAWLGGFEKPAASNKDQLHQDVTVPAGTTSLTLAGQYWVGSAEILPGSFDIGSVELASTSNNSLENVLALDNLDETTTWTPFTKTFANSYAGQTVRIRLTSAGDSSNVTNFFYDSLSLTATVTCP